MAPRRASALLLVSLLALGACDGVVDGGDDGQEDLDPGGDVLQAGGAGRHHVTADIDRGGGVILANRPGGYYMGRLEVGWSFDRVGAWHHSYSNDSDYAWAMAWGHSNACLWVGPSRGKSGWTHDRWATAVDGGFADRCSDAERTWLAENDGANLGSHFNCPPPSDASHGTEKVLLVDAPLYWNLSWEGGAMGYDGGELRDLVKTIPAGTHVWYRYTTRDGQAIVAFVPGVGWGFFPIGVLDRSRTGMWSSPTDPLHPHSC